MNADPDAQLRLLDLQAVDTALAQLRHRRSTLPEVAEVDALQRRLARLSDDAVQAQTQVDDLTREQRRIDRDVEQVRGRQSKDRQRMLAGGMPAKELTGLEHELTSLARRQSALEDSELEIMQQVEDAEKAVTAIRDEQAQLQSQAAGQIARRDATFAEIDAAVDERVASRAGTADGLPADLVTLYEKVRDASGGVGAAALRARRCEGCRIELSPSELSIARAAAADDVLRCEECRRILVRVPESGL